jgi:hypothetical protein
MNLENQTMLHTVNASGFSPPACGRFLLAPEASEVAGGGGAAPTVDPLAQGTPSDALGAGTSDLGGITGGGSGVEGGAPNARPDFGSGLDMGSGTAAAAGGVGGGAPTPAPVSAEWQSIRDAAGALGYDLSAYTDDRAALAHLVQSAAQAKQANYYAQLGQQLAPHAPAIQQYLQTQKTPPAPERPSYAPPEFDKRWLSLVEFDANTGMYLSKPGAPPEVAQKVNAFADWQEKFRNNPLEMITPAIEDRLSKAVEERVATVIASHQRTQSINQIVAQNSDWLYQAGADGRPVVGPDGRFMPTPQGARYAQHVSHLQRSGMSDPVTIDSMARNLLAGEIAVAQVQQARQQQQSGAMAAPALAVARSQANPLQAAAMAAPGAFVPGASDPTDSGLSLSDMLRRDMKMAGISDADFASIDQDMS